MQTLAQAKISAGSSIAVGNDACLVWRCVTLLSHCPATIFLLFYSRAAHAFLYLLQYSRSLVDAQ
jgi:hypothetical protein